MSEYVIEKIYSIHNCALCMYENNHNYLSI